MKENKIKVIDSDAIYSLLTDIDCYLNLVNSAIKVVDMVSDELCRERRSIKETRNVCMLDSVDATIEDTTDVLYLAMDSLRTQSESIQSATDRIAELINL